MIKNLLLTALVFVSLNILAITNDSIKIVKTIGYGRSIDLNVAKQIAISESKFKATNCNGEYTIVNFKILDEKVVKNNNGVYYYAMQASMIVK